MQVVCSCGTIRHDKGALRFGPQVEIEGDVPFAPTVVNSDVSFASASVCCYASG